MQHRSSSVSHQQQSPSTFLIFFPGIWWMFVSVTHYVQCCLIFSSPCFCQSQLTTNHNELLFSPPRKMMDVSLQHILYSVLPYFFLCSPSGYQVQCNVIWSCSWCLKVVTISNGFIPFFEMQELSEKIAMPASAWPLNNHFWHTINGWRCLYLQIPFVCLYFLTIIIFILLCSGRFWVSILL